MGVGNIVVVKGLNLMGEVLEIDDCDMATLSLYVKVILILRWLYRIWRLRGQYSLTGRVVRV